MYPNQVNPTGQPAPAQVPHESLNRRGAPKTLLIVIIALVVALLAATVGFVSGSASQKSAYEQKLEKAAKDLDFMQAAKFRDEIKKLQEQLT